MKMELIILHREISKGNNLVSFGQKNIPALVAIVSLARKNIPHLLYIFF